MKFFKVHMNFMDTLYRHIGLFLLSVKSKMKIVGKEHDIIQAKSLLTSYKHDEI